MSRKRQSVPSQPVTTEIETLSHDGRGIARVNGKTTFIQGALAGETVVFHYTQVKKDFDEGRVLSVLNASEFRVKPRCIHYHSCGGCSLQHMDEKAQIHAKQDLLLNSLQRIGHAEPESILEPLVSSSWSYRNKARLSVSYVEKKQTSLVGFRKKNNPRFIADITECPVLHPKIEANLLQLRSLLDSFDTRDIIAQIEVAAGDEHVALIFRNMRHLSADDETKLRAFGESSGFTLFLQPAGPDSVFLFYPEENSGFLQYTLPLEKVRFNFRPTDFTQVNAGLNRLMVARAVELMDIKPDDVILDLFCGLGNFSLPMANYCKKVIGIEGSDAMAKRAEDNALANNINNTVFFSGDLDKPDVLSAYKSAGITKILIDPPRTGALEIVRQINTLNPVRIVYVSCNPATLARDTDILVNQHGYRFKAAGVMDMFPHTAHVESIALFEKDS